MTIIQQINKPQKGNGSGEYAKWFGLGIEFCTVTGFFCYIGYKLDKALDTSPWLLVSGFFIGFAGMIYTILKQFWNTRPK